MKLFSLFCFVFLVTHFSLSAQGVKFYKDNPEAGSAVKFSYNPKGVFVKSSDTIKCEAYSFYSTPSPKMIRIKLIKEGDVYIGEVPTNENASLIGLAFSAGKQKDEPENGYLIRLNKGGKENAISYLSLARVFQDLGGRYFGLKSDLAKSALYYKKAFEIDPSLKDKYLMGYFRTEYTSNKVTGTKLVDTKINQLLKIEQQSEKETILLANLFLLIKKTKQADSVKAMSMKRYPLGYFSFSSAENSLSRTDPPREVEVKANEIIKKFNLEDGTIENERRLSGIHRFLYWRFSKSQDLEKFEYYANKEKDPLSLANRLNNYAFGLAKKNVEIDFALKISRQSLELVDHAPKEDTSGWYLSQEEYSQSVKEAYGNNADTYAFLLYRKGKYQEALNYQEKAILLTPSAEVSARYVTYLIKNDEKDKAFKQAEKLIAEGNGSDSLKVEFKNLYVSLKKEGDYQTYLTRLEAQGLESVSDSWKKEMIKIPAPAFSLLNIKGERVTLASLKGKVVVLDYWATWCVPCIASFPGMQQSVNNYKNNPDVVFLFINTAEVAENREVLIKKLLEEKNFDFNVLLDTKNAKDESKYDIKTAYKVQGIPAKFIIDKQGNIRFKREGSTDDIATITKEMDIMIGLVQNDDNG